jgi:hypothetical protein
MEPDELDLPEPPMRQEIDDPASARKQMRMCFDNVLLAFPKYPSSGTIIGNYDKTWREKGIGNAYNAVNPNPCRNNYAFGVVKGFPTQKQDGDLFNPKGKDAWQTEHVMNGQIMKRFLMDMFEKQLDNGSPIIATNKIPEAWIPSTKGLRKGNGKQKQQTTCDYLEQFWTKRWDPVINKQEVNASEYSGACSC